MLNRILKVLFTGVFIGVFTVVTAMVLPEKYTGYIGLGLVIFLIPSYWLSKFVLYRLVIRGFRGKKSAKEVADSLNKL